MASLPNRVKLSGVGLLAAFARCSMTLISAAARTDARGQND
jgi:hypothetical protein